MDGENKQLGVQQRPRPPACTTRRERRFVHEKKLNKNNTNTNRLLFGESLWADWDAATPRSALAGVLGGQLAKLPLGTLAGDRP